MDLTGFWRDTPTNVLYAQLEYEHVFSPVPNRPQYLMTIRNELHRRGMPLVPAASPCPACFELGCQKQH